MVGTWLKRNVDDSGDIGVNKLGGSVIVIHTSQLSLVHTSLYNVGTLLTFHPLDGTGECSLEEWGILQALCSQSNL